MSIELSLFKFVDALQFPLSYEDGKISGSIQGVMDSGLGFGIPFIAKAKKICMNEQNTLLIHVVGDLYILVSHFQATGAVSAYLINGALLEMDGVKTPPDLFMSKKMSLREIIDALGKAVVKAFYWKGNEWKNLMIPK